jgi:hypothetical protein
VGVLWRDFLCCERASEHGEQSRVRRTTCGRGGEGLKSFVKRARWRAWTSGAPDSTKIIYLGNQAPQPSLSIIPRLASHSYSLTHARTPTHLKLLVHDPASREIGVEKVDQAPLFVTDVVLASVSDVNVNMDVNVCSGWWVTWRHGTE